MFDNTLSGLRATLDAVTRERDNNYEIYAAMVAERDSWKERHHLVAEALAMLWQHYLLPISDEQKRQVADALAAVSAAQPASEERRVGWMDGDEDLFPERTASLVRPHDSPPQPASKQGLEARLEATRRDAFFWGAYYVNDVLSGGEIRKLYEEWRRVNEAQPASEQP
jgi:hypothetical protein